MVDTAGTKEPVRVTYSDGFDGLPVPSPDGTTAGVDVEPRRAARAGQLFLAQWNHEKALEALAERAAAESRARSHDDDTKRLQSTRDRDRCRRSRSSRPAAAASAQTAAAAVADARARRDARVGRARGPADRIARRAARRPTTSSPSCSASARSRCRADRLPHAVRVHGRHRRTAARRSTITHETSGSRRRSTARDARAGAVVLRQRRRSPAPVVFAGYGIVVPDSQDFGYDSYADARREGQDRPRAALLPRGRRPEDARRSSRATPTCATRRWRRGSAARRRMLVVTGPALAERRRDRCR